MHLCFVLLQNYGGDKPFVFFLFYLKAQYVKFLRTFAIE